MTHGVIIPAHNEGQHLEETVTAFLRALPEGLTLTEILLVENGSRDDTLQVCHHLQQTFPDLIRVLSLGRGSYGEAIKLGMLECRCEYLSILECDFLDAGFLVASVDLFKSQGAQFTLASKRHRDSIDHRPIKRRMLTALYNVLLLHLFLGYPGTDTHGLKSIEARLAKRLCGLAVTTDEIFQTEIVLIAWRLGFKIHELPIRILETRPAPVSVVRRLPKVMDTVRQLKDSLKRFPEGPAGPTV